MTLWAWILIARGYRARRADRLFGAQQLFIRAIVASRRSGSSIALIRALKGLGQIERDLGRGDDALPLYEEAVGLCRRDGDALGLAHTIRHLSDIHQRLGRWIVPSHATKKLWPSIAAMVGQPCSIWQMPFGRSQSSRRHLADRTRRSLFGRRRATCIPG